MGLTIHEKAEYVATLRWVEVFLMEMLSRWVATTPEMEVKVLFGRHIWDTAQHADALGKRAFEMRAPLHYTLPPAEDYAALLKELGTVEKTADRIGVVYEVMLPALARRYEAYLKNSDALLDEPTFRVIERSMDDGERMRREAADLRKEVPNIGGPDPGKVKVWCEREASMMQIVCHSQSPALARGGAA